MAAPALRALAAAALAPVVLPSNLTAESSDPQFGEVSQQEYLRLGSAALEWPHHVHWWGLVGLGLAVSAVALALVVYLNCTSEDEPGKRTRGIRLEFEDLDIVDDDSKPSQASPVSMLKPEAPAVAFQQLGYRTVPAHPFQQYVQQLLPTNSAPRYAPLPRYTSPVTYLDPHHS
eukprot:TRINITY_DN69480_c0_g1_i1.p1 TRINITY_DN69480_c0_g1~~TRINITY_DN69480_c0_g1_i1.p1  ORF type:complete len:198 (-),score=23.51 TRINITY_DN69480_c0_g1_i1:85-606(-)